MQTRFEYAATTFVWHEAKARENRRKHGVIFAEAATVLMDPLLVMLHAGEEAETRSKTIGFSAEDRLLTVVHIEFETEFIRIISAWRASPTEEALYDQ